MSETSQQARFRSFCIPQNQRFYLLEKLKSSLQIAEVFKSSVSYSKYPLLAFVQQGDYRNHTPYLAQVAFTVSKKKFKRAVDRNHNKRLMRETYRTQKANFYKNLSQQQQYRIVFVYIGKEIVSYQKVEKSMQFLLQKIIENETT